jgi:2-keto-3-deoxy-6-phosphogluconate aldolase
VISRELRIVIEVSGKKSSIHDRTKVEFYYNHGIRWIEITNETVKSNQAVRAICQAIAVLVQPSHPERVWSGADLS